MPVAPGMGRPLKPDTSWTSRQARPVPRSGRLGARWRIAVRPRHPGSLRLFAARSRAQSDSKRTKPRFRPREARHPSRRRQQSRMVRPRPPGLFPVGRTSPRRCYHRYPRSMLAPSLQFHFLLLDARIRCSGRASGSPGPSRYMAESGNDEGWNCGKIVAWELAGCAFVANHEKQSGGTSGDRIAANDTCDRLAGKNTRCVYHYQFLQLVLAAPSMDAPMPTSWPAS